MHALLSHKRQNKCVLDTLISTTSCPSLQALASMACLRMRLKLKFLLCRVLANHLLFYTYFSWLNIVAVLMWSSIRIIGAVLVGDPPLRSESFRKHAFIVRLWPALILSSWSRLPIRANSLLWMCFLLSWKRTSTYLSLVHNVWCHPANVRLINNVRVHSKISLVLSCFALYCKDMLVNVNTHTYHHNNILRCIY